MRYRYNGNEFILRAQERTILFFMHLCVWKKKKDWKKGNLSLSLQSLQLTGSATFPIWVKIFDFNAISAFFLRVLSGVLWNAFTTFSIFLQRMCAHQNLTMNNNAIANSVWQQKRQSRIIFTILNLLIYSMDKTIYKREMWLGIKIILT